MKNLKNTVLIVDDNRGLREVIRIFLSDEGYNVLEAGNGKEALDLLSKLSAAEYPSCMVLDLRMPVMDGNEFLDRLDKGSVSELKNIPVIIYSAEGKLRPNRQVVAKLEKPVSIEILCGAIKGCSGMLDQYRM